MSLLQADIASCSEYYNNINNCYHSYTKYIITSPNNPYFKPVEINATNVYSAWLDALIYLHSAYGIDIDNHRTANPVFSAKSVNIFTMHCDFIIMDNGPCTHYVVNSGIIDVEYQKRLEQQMDNLNNNPFSSIDEYILHNC